MSVTVVVPAYNEERTIGAVVEAARAAGPLVREVIVVDDGSTDDTAARAQLTGARVLRLPFNTGKARALSAGVREASEETLVLLDGDLLGLRPEHLYRLAVPVLKGEAHMTVGVFRHGRPLTDLAQFLAPQLSGQRALSRALFLRAVSASGPGFALELALNAYAQRHGLVIRRVALEGVSHVTKEEKRGFWPGLQARMQMYRDLWRGPD
ncbi:MAG: glycosyltransferase [Clostridia bacterium]|nr:glycosyltransferase [Clostridia bacterium]